jgi:hypothetical protein
MMADLSRRRLLQLAAAPSVLGALGISAWAQARDAIAIAFPTDVPTWDPNARVLVGVQSLYKCVVDSPLFQGIKTVAHQRALQWTRYDNGWILPQSYALKG